VVVYLDIVADRYSAAIGNSSSKKLVHELVKAGLTAQMF
jgi:hypothetical protein